jgi:hypothetical protein
VVQVTVAVLEPTLLVPALDMTGGALVPPTSESVAQVAPPVWIGGELRGSINLQTSREDYVLALT